MPAACAASTARQNLLQHGRDPRPRQSGAADQGATEGIALEPLHHEIREPGRARARVSEVHDVDHVGMAQRTNGPGLGLEAPLALGRRGQGRPQHLQRIGATRVEVLHAKDDAHTAGAESLAHAILAVDDVVRARHEEVVQLVVVHTMAE